MPDLGAHRELRQALDGATEGPWGADHTDAAEWGSRVISDGEDWPDGTPYTVTDGIRGEDATFIAAARNHLPALLDDYERLAERVEALEDTLGAVYRYLPDDLTGLTPKVWIRLVMDDDALRAPVGVARHEQDGK